MINVNKSLGKKPTIFLIPADQVLPWGIIAMVGFYFGRQLLGFSLIQTFLFIVWGISTWWFLTAPGYHHFFSRLMNEPKWVRAIIYYEAIIDGESGHKEDQRSNQWKEKGTKTIRG